MTVTTWRIPSALNLALDSVTVAPDRTSATVGDRTVESESPRELRRLLEVRVPDLVAYQDAALARTYAGEVAQVARLERERGAPGETAIAEAFARGLHKLLAYKDEYEVARLHLDAVEEARREAAEDRAAEAALDAAREDIR